MLALAGGHARGPSHERLRLVLTDSRHGGRFEKCPPRDVIDNPRISRTRFQLKFCVLGACEEVMIFTLTEPSMFREARRMSSADDQFDVTSS